MQSLRNTANTSVISSGSQQISLISNGVGSVYSCLVLAASRIPFIPCKKWHIFVQPQQITLP